MDVEISVVLCTYNRAPSLQRVLESFSALQIPPDLHWELLVVDNNSTDNTVEVIQQFTSRANFCVRYVFERRQGRSAALNAGVAKAKGEIVAFTDDDVILHPAWLSQLKQAFAEHDCAAVAGRVIPVWKHPVPDWLEMEDQQAIVHFDLGDELRAIPSPPLGANSAFRKRVFEKYGLFRLDLGVSGENRGITCEDTEFGFRLVHAGEKIVYAPQVIIYHPVELHRSTKAFFLKWYYNDGRSAMRSAGWAESVVCYFGVPRWIYRGLVTHFFRWVFSLDEKSRFHYKLRTYRNIGHLVEARRLSRRSENPAIRRSKDSSGNIESLEI
jgi:glycosyltransferase involved in cell wall biosynthesis